MKNYFRLNNIVGWLVGIAACAVYVMTAERTTSWWDCGEYISTAFKLQVGHPPGAPTFQLLGNLFSLITLRDPMTAGFMVNAMSAIASGFSILFLFWSITLLGKKLVLKYGEMTPAKMWTIFGSGIVMTPDLETVELWATLMTPFARSFHLSAGGATVCKRSGASVDHKLLKSVECNTSCLVPPSTPAGLMIVALSVLVPELPSSKCKSTAASPC